MFRKFAEGLAFGTGFAIAFLVVQLFIPTLVMPLFFNVNDRVLSQPEASSSVGRMESEAGPDFNELSVEEQIKRASVVALARFEPGKDGKRIAVLTEILKQTPGTTFYYKVGEEFPDGSVYSQEGTEYGDGLVIFFTGSPASMRMSMTYSGERIRGLGDIPLKLFREKCEPDA